MQMRFIVYAWQIIEHQLQAFFCIIIVSNYHKAKTVISMLITELFSSINKFAETLCHIIPFHSNKYSHEQTPAYFIYGICCSKYIGMFSYCYILKHLIRAGTTQMLANKVFDRCILMLDIIHLE